MQICDADTPWSYSVHLFIFQSFLSLFSVSESHTNLFLKFWHCLSNSCYLAEKPVIMSKCLLLLINSCNYRGESWDAVCGNHSSGLQWHSCASPPPVTEPHTWLYGNSNCDRFSKSRHLIISATVTDQLETAVKRLSGLAVGYGVYDFNTWLFSYKVNVMTCKLLQTVIISTL